MGSSNNINQAFSLPVGGGAQVSIGEKFTADLFTGTGNFTIPLALPTGRGGIQPELSLSYSSGAGNSMYGLGWGISLPSITRKTSKGVPLYGRGTNTSRRDTFIFSGSEDLVPLNESTEPIQRFRPRTEGLFSLIDYFNQDTNHWEVRGKDGMISFYGTPKPFDAAPGWSDPAIIADPNNREKIFSWCLTRTQDPFGNHVLYEYDRDMREEGPHHWDQLYLRRIRYIDYEGEDGKPHYLVSVIFQYEERPDPFSFYRAGFEIRTIKRCTHIDVVTEQGESILTRRYHLIYLDHHLADLRNQHRELTILLNEDPGNLENKVQLDYLTLQLSELELEKPQNKKSLLSRVKVVGHDGDRSEEMPAIDFNYKKFDPGNRNFFPVAGKDAIPSPANPDTELVDLFGTGLPDLMQMNGVIRYWRNLGNGNFDLPRTMSDGPAGLNFGDAGVQIVDADGDSRADLLINSFPLSGYFPLRFGGEWDRRSFKKYDTAPSFNFLDPEVRLLDLTGDGVTDALRSGTRLECFFNDPDEGWKEVRLLERKQMEEFPNLNFSDQRVKLGDFSGDGLQDISLIYDGNISYWPNLGHGNWGKQIKMSNSPHFPYGYDMKQILVGDIDGDGLADIVYVGGEEVYLFLNQNGNSWSDPIIIDGTPAITDMDSIRLADILGKGIPGILWSRNFFQPGSDHSFFLDFVKEGNPYLLREIKNNMGVVTRINYESSTKFFLTHQEKIGTRWKTPLPFPVNVVASVEVIDEISRGKLTSEYTYHHGYWDGTEREFRGFGRVDQRDTEQFENFHSDGLHGTANFAAVDASHFTPPVETRTWFHQGPVGDIFSGFNEPDYSHEYWSGDANVLRRPTPAVVLLESLPANHRRDALRCLRGTTIRSEVYALDGNELSERPYSIKESVYSLRQEETPPDSPQLIFFPQLFAQRTTQWERGNDPMTSFTFTENYDEFGQPKNTTGISCPRGWLNMDQIIPDSTPFLADFSRTEYAYSQGSVYIKDRVARSTEYNLRHTGFKNVNQLKEETSNPASLEVISQQLHYYDGEAFVGLPNGEIGQFGAVCRSENLVLTESILQDAYDDGIAPYLVPGSTVNWTDEYPLEFRNRLPELAGYVFHDGSGVQERGFFTTKNSTRYDFHNGPGGKGLPLVKKDPIGKENFVEYDEFDLMPVRLTDPVGLTREMINDYKIFKPFRSVDINGNHAQVSYTPLGYVETIVSMGKPGENVGDSFEVPGKRMRYDFLNYQDKPPALRMPIGIFSEVREYHVHDNNVDAEKKDNTISKVEYCDGYGRITQQRTQSEDVRFGDPLFGNDIIPADQNTEPGSTPAFIRNPGDPLNVVVSGLQVFNNKGLLVQQYESFFSSGFEFSTPGPGTFGKKTEMFYDPRGNLVRTVNPDQSTKIIVFGIPRALNTPNDFVPSPWEAYTYDSNDLAPLFTGEHGVDPSHWFTPSSIEIDALGRTVKNTAHTGNLPAQKLTVVTEYDNRSNIFRQTDALGRVAFQNVYDLGDGSNKPNLLRETSIDAGARQIVYDALGSQIEIRDEKGSLILQAIDEVSRPTHTWGRNNRELPVTLRQRLIYGDRAGLPNPESDNLKGKLYRHFDEGGLHVKEKYAFNNTLIVQSRQYLSDDVILSAAGNDFSNYQTDWDELDPVSSLEDAVYVIETELDALKRLKTIKCPLDISGDNKLLKFEYDRSGKPQKMLLLSNQQTDEKVIIQHAGYNAKGQRCLVVYGNKLMCRLSIDAATARTIRTRIEKYRIEGDFNFTPDGGVVQDTGYKYDLVGNIIQLSHRHQGAGVPNTTGGIDALDQNYEYDSFYRLVFASGREHNTKNASGNPWLDAMAPTGTDITDTRLYTETYLYDNGNNLLQLRHNSGTSNSFTQDFTIAAGSNRVDNYALAGSTFDIRYDACGNMVQETLSRHFAWDCMNRLLSFRVQAGSAPSISTLCLYDAGGQRTKKITRKQDGAISSSQYIGSFFEAHQFRGKSNNIILAMDEKTCIAQLRAGDAFDDDESPAMQYHSTDHISSIGLSTNENGSFLLREEYYVYGGTSFGSYRKKRFRFTGKETDDESGLRYHGARYYAPWLMRWASPDPAGRVDGLNLYRYARNNPMCFLDPTGTQSVPMPGDDPGAEFGLMSAGVVPTNGLQSPSAKSSKWDWVKSAASTVWEKIKAIYQKEKEWALKPREWNSKARGILWDRTKKYAGNIWEWAKNHWILAGTIAIGITVLSIIFRKFMYNWVLQTGLRVASNAALGYAMGGTTGAYIMGTLGLTHGFAMAYAGSYYSIPGFFMMIVDNTWNIFNSGIASIFATVNLPFNKINKAQSSSSDTFGHLYFESSWFGDYATTLGNVTVGKAVPEHEMSHAMQARFLGPYYIPAVLINYQINFLLPWWKLFGRTGGPCAVGGFEGYAQGVYQNTWHELISYSIEGNKC